jgi:hypothetical protein
MLTRIGGKIVFECDQCADTLDTEESDFGDALGVMRDSGWKAVKIGQDWSHRCDACKEAA